MAPVIHSSMLSTAVPLGTIFLRAAVLSGEITRDYDDLMMDFRHAFASRDEQIMDQLENIMFLRRVAEVWNLTLTMSYNDLSEKLLQRVLWIRDEYLAKHSPGDAIPKYTTSSFLNLFNLSIFLEICRELQLLKGCMREAEVTICLCFICVLYFCL